MNVFEFRDRVIADYSAYIRSFISIRDERIRDRVETDLEAGLLWAEPRIGLDPAFAEGAWIDELVQKGVLHPECAKIFRIKSSEHDAGTGLKLHRHQLEAIQAAQRGRNYVLTTGTGSGKSLAYIVPIVDAVLKRGAHKGIQAIVVYPMNALANSQGQELTKFLYYGYPDSKGPVTFRRYTGQENDEERQQILADPPDILLTNYYCDSQLRLQYSLAGVYPRGNPLPGGAPCPFRSRRARLQLSEEELDWLPHLRHSRADPAGRLAVGTVQPPNSYEAFIKDPLSRWIESAFGLTTEADSGRLLRAAPRPIGGPEGGATELSALTDVTQDQCAQAIQDQLLTGYTIRRPEVPVPGVPAGGGW